MNPNYRLAFALLAACTAAAAYSQVNFGPETYPHYRGMSGLPGGGFGVRPDGSTGMDGAMAISTPIGFSLSDWHGDIGGSSLSYNSQFTGINVLRRSNSFASTGMVVGMIGYGGNWGRVTASFELISSVLDHVENLQYQLPFKSNRYGISVGAQDIGSHGGAEGEGVSPAGHNPTSRSLYIVGTALVTKGLYVSVGKGDYRFKNGPFGNVSYNLTPRLKAVGEYDTFSWNYSFAYGLGRIPGISPYGRAIEPVASLGYVGGNRALAMLNFAF